MSVLAGHRGRVWLYAVLAFADLVLSAIVEGNPRAPRDIPYWGHVNGVIGPVSFLAIAVPMAITRPRVGGAIILGVAVLTVAVGLTGQQPFSMVLRLPAVLALLIAALALCSGTENAKQVRGQRGNRDS